MDKDCYVKVEKRWGEAEFIGVYQHSNVIDASPMIGGHPAGVVAYPIVVVKQHGGFKQFKLSEVIFKE